MNNGNNIPRGKVTLGAHVVFTQDAAFFGYPTNEIFEITDSRHHGHGQYTFSLTPVTVPATLNATYHGIFADDLQAVG